MNLEKTETEQGFRITLTLKNADRRRVTENLDKGFRCGVMFQIRLSCGDRKKIVVKTEASRDYLSGNYLITRNGIQEFYSDSDAFFDAFFSAGDLIIPCCDGSSAIMEAMAVIDYLKKPAPFDILDSFFTEDLEHTEWLRVEEGTL